MKIYITIGIIYCTGILISMFVWGILTRNDNRRDFDTTTVSIIILSIVWLPVCCILCFIHGLYWLSNRLVDIGQKFGKYLFKENKNETR